MSATPVPILPDDCIWEIFKHLPLQDLFKGIRPIRCWRLILKLELNRRKTLFLSPSGTLSRLSGFYWDYYYRELLDHVRRDDGPAWPETLSTCALPNKAQLKFSGMPMYDAMKATLRRNPLPNITNLTMQHHGVTMERYRGIIPLIRLWSPKLISLRLNFRFKSNIKNEDISHNVETVVVALFEALNHIPTLRHLYLSLDFPCAEHWNRFVSLPDNLRFSFLSHLDTFCFEAILIDEDKKSLFSSLRDYATANEHLRICLHPEFSMEDGLKLGPQLNSKFTRIVTRVDERLISSFFAQFTSLTTLTLDCEPYMMAQLSQHLRLLPSLFSLELMYGCPFSSDPSKTITDRPGQEEDQPIEPEHYSQVLSVRLLLLRIITKSHHNIAKLHIAEIFPNVQVIKFGHIIQVCSDCDYNISKVCPKDEVALKLKNKIYECMRLARQPFVDCTNLRQIQYNDDPFEKFSYMLISADQLRQSIKNLTS